MTLLAFDTSVNKWASSEDALVYPGIGDAVKAVDGTWSGTDHTSGLRDWIGQLFAKWQTDGIVQRGRIARGQYIFTAPLITTTDVYHDLEIFGDGDSSVLVNKNPAGGGILPTGITSGQIAAGNIVLTAPTVLRDQVLTVNTTVGFVEGQWLLLRDPANPLYAYYPDVYSGFAGQAVRLRQIVDSTHIRLDGDCEYAYNIGTFVVRYTTRDHFYFHDLAFDYDPIVAPANYTMDFKYCHDVRIERILMKNRNTFGIRANESFGGEISDIRDVGAHNEDNYSVQVQNSSAFWRVNRLFQYGGRHAIDLGGDINYVPASDVYITNCMSIYPESNGFDTHNNCRRVTFDGVKTIGFANPIQEGSTGAGVLVRGIDCKVINSEFVGTGVGVLIANRGSALVENNTVMHCRAGVRVDTASSVHIRNNYFRDCLEHFVEFASADGKTDYLVEGNIGIGPLTLSAWYMPSPTWDRSWVFRNNYAPNATIQYPTNTPDQVYQPHLSTAANYTLTWPDGPMAVGKPIIEAPRRRLMRQSLSANDTLIPTNASVPFPIGTLLELIQIGAGNSSLTPDTGVTLNGVTTAFNVPGRYARAILEKIGTDSWVVSMQPATIVASQSYNPPSLIDGANATTTVSVAGAALGDLAFAAFSLDLQGVGLRAWVSAADTVSVKLRNDTGGTLDLGAGTLKAWVLKT